MKNNNLVVLVGESCAGKDSLAAILKERLGYSFIISHTSRPIRQNESEGNPYYFVTYDEFNKMADNNEFIEYRTYFTKTKDNQDDIWMYGIHKNSIDLENNNYISIVDLQGLKDLNRFFNDNIISFYINVDEETRKQRCIKRGDYNEFEWTRRAIDDNDKFNYGLVSKVVDYVVPNYDLQTCVDIITETIYRGD
jgi:guanylate kinase